MGLAEYLAQRRVMQEPRSKSPMQRVLQEPRGTSPMLHVPAPIPTQGYAQTSSIPRNMAPAPGVFDRSQPTNPLELQLAMRRMLDAQGRGMTRGVGYDTSAPPTPVPQRGAFPRPRMPIAQNAPVTLPLYGGR